jgi:hypothetical protein
MYRKHQRGLKRTCQADSADFWIHELEKKVFAGGEGKNKYPVRWCKVCKFCIVLLHKGSCFEKYLSVTNY